MAMRSGLVRPLAALALGGWLGSAAIAQQPPPLTEPAPAPAPPAAPVDAAAVAPMTPDGHGDNGGWYVEGEGLLWRRNTTRRAVGFVDVNNNLVYDQADLTIETRMLHFDFEPGVRITVGCPVDGGWGVDASFMALSRSSNSQTINATTTTGLTGNIFSLFQFETPTPIIGTFVFPFDFATSYRLDASSHLFGGEINAHCSTPCSVGMVTVLAGFRYIHFKDNFLLTANGANGNDVEVQFPVTGTYDVHATNNLFGAQVGAIFDANLAEGLRLGLSTKFGMFDNFARQGQEISNITIAGGAPFGIAGTAEVDRFAAVLEFGVFLHWWATPNIGVNIGYQGMFITDVALAPKQLSFNLDPAAHNIIDTSGEVFYHGVSAGIEIRF
jgi:hypothetical protein